MTSMEEFAFISAQLGWLEAQLRALPPVERDGRMEGAINALTCARAVIDTLDRVGRAAEGRQVIPLGLEPTPAREMHAR
jgi:hypothetical protein